MPGKGWALLTSVALACAPADAPTDSADDTDDSSSTDSDLPADSDTDTRSPVDAARLQAMADVIASLPALLSSLDVAPAQAAMARVDGMWEGGCVVEIERLLGTLYSVDCDLPDSLRIFGQLVWNDTRTGLSGEARRARVEPALLRAGVVPTEDDYAYGVTGAFVAGDMLARRDITTLVQLNGWYERNRGAIGPHAVDMVILDGSVRDDEAAPGSWPALGLAPEDLAIARVWRDDGALFLVADGALSGLPGPLATVDVDEVMWRSDGCALEPEGTVALREADGVWIEVTFDPATTCDGCGIARVPGYLDAPVCMPAPELIVDLGAKP